MLYPPWLLKHRILFSSSFFLFLFKPLLSRPPLSSNLLLSLRHQDTPNCQAKSLLTSDQWSSPVSLRKLSLLSQPASHPPLTYVTAVVSTVSLPPSNPPSTLQVVIFWKIKFEDVSLLITSFTKQNNDMAWQRSLAAYPNIIFPLLFQNPDCQLGTSSPPKKDHISSFPCSRYLCQSAGHCD